MWYVYILQCQDGALYTGVTDNLKRRFSEHKSGKGGCYTNSNRPDKVLYSETFQDQFVAENRECQIKRWTKVKKLALIQGNLPELKSLSQSRD